MFPRRLKLIETDLASSDANVVARALDELSRSRRAKAMDLLFRKSRDDSFSSTELAADGFRQSVATHPKVALRHSSVPLRKAAIRALGLAKVVKAVSELSGILRSAASVEMRCLSAEALGSIGHATCVPALMEARGDSMPEVRKAALHGLQQIAGVESERAVIGFLEDSDWSIRLDAKEHLESAGWTPVERRHKALWGIALGRFDEAISHGQDSAEALVDATLHVNNGEVRRWSTVALSRLNSPWATDRLREALGSKSRAEQVAAADALQTLGLPVEPKVLRRLRQPEPPPSTGATRDSLFAAAAQMLSLIGQP